MIIILIIILLIIIIIKHLVSNFHVADSSEVRFTKGFTLFKITVQTGPGRMDILQFQIPLSVFPELNSFLP